MDKNTSADKLSVILWLLQRVTAILIFLVLGLHIFKVHYADIGQPILFSGIVLRLKRVFTFGLDISLLFLVLFHGLNGLRSVLIDFNFFSKYEKIVSLILLLIGVVFAIWGLRGLWAFILIRS
ncbi:MAG: hypothetical protein AABZ57_06955 [Candidatus Margulisiibacteriota bacterium]